MNRILYEIAALAHRLGYWAERKADQRHLDRLRRDYHRTRGEPWVTPGVYTTRDGKTVTVVPNEDGWLDKLPFKIVRDGRPFYTVDEWGRVYDTNRDAGDLIAQ